ncbi:MAG: hypothetical protein J6023_03750 [Clostridia bacterium]|nr:hypothetical protein [Clostridia bacterium]
MAMDAFEKNLDRFAENAVRTVSAADFRFACVRTNPGTNPGTLRGFLNPIETRT